MQGAHVLCDFSMHHRSAYVFWLLRHFDGAFFFLLACVFYATRYCHLCASCTMCVNALVFCFRYAHQGVLYGKLLYTNVYLSF